MLEVSVNQIASTPTLRIGLVVRYGDGGPVRFAVASIEDDVLDLATLRDLEAWVHRQRMRLVSLEERARDLGEDPLF